MTFSGMEITLYCCGVGERNSDPPSASLAEFIISNILCSHPEVSIFGQPLFFQGKVTLLTLFMREPIMVECLKNIEMTSRYSTSLMQIFPKPSMCCITEG
jgi:hypothetical protein